MATNVKVDDTKFFEKVIDLFGEIGAKISQQRQMSVLRDSFATLLPVIIIGSLSTMVMAVFLSPSGLMAGWFGVEAGTSSYETWANVSSYIMPVFSGIYGSTMSMINLYLVFFFGYFTLRSYGEDNGAIIGGAISLAAFLLLTPVAAGDGGMKYFGADGILFGMIMGLSAPVVFYHLSNVESFNIKLPPSVPPMVGKSLGMLIPFAIVLLSFGLIQPVWQIFANEVWPTGIEIGGEATDVSYLLNAFSAFLAKPLENIGTSIWTVFFILFLITLFWFFGIHGNNVMIPILTIIWFPPMFSNQEVLASFGGDVHAAVESGELFVWTHASMSAWVNLGGTGYIISLVIAINIFSKDPAQKAMGRVGIPTSMFNISEPMVYGIPIMLNPFYMIPFIFIQPIIGVMAYTVTSLGLVNPAVQFMPWTTPPILLSMLQTLDWRAGVWSSLFLVLAVAMYSPFVIIASKSELKKAAVAEGMELDAYMEKVNEEMKEEKIQRKVNKPITKSRKTIAKLNKKKTENLNLIELENNKTEDKNDVLIKELESSNISIEQEIERINKDAEQQSKEIESKLR